MADAQAEEYDLPLYRNLFRAEHLYYKGVDYFFKAPGRSLPPRPAAAPAAACLACRIRSDLLRPLAAWRQTHLNALKRVFMIYSSSKTNDPRYAATTKVRTAWVPVTPPRPTLRAAHAWMPLGFMAFVAHDCSAP